MHASKAAAEAAALEGVLSSPDTQECQRIFQAAIGCDFDSKVTTTDDCTSINKPQLSPQSPGRILQPLYNLDVSVPGIDIFCCSRQAGQCMKAQAALDLRKQTPHFSGAISNNITRAHSCLSDLQDSRAEHIDVHPTRTSALYESTKRAIQSDARGIAVIACSKMGAMDRFISPLDGSDSSNLSPTQENDPAVYIRLQQELQTLAHDSQASSLHIFGTTENSQIKSTSASGPQDTGITYAVNDTGHLTLDYQPPPSDPLHDSFDEEEVVEGISSGRLQSQPIDGGLLHPQTPAQARIVIGHLGTIMRPSQMFAETQPSPGSRDRHMLPPSSSRPSPALFNQYQSPKHLTSSPLARRIDKIQFKDPADFNLSSSPESLLLGGDAKEKSGTRQLLSERANVETHVMTKSPSSSNLIQHDFPEPFEVYTTLKESQERRRQQAMAMDDAGQSSDDGFSDDEAELNRRARRRKEVAARELAVISTSRPGSAGNDLVEVPSTNTGRRRSLAEDYEAQCSGYDARDTQPDDTILDSQSAPTGVTGPSLGEAPFLRENNEISQSYPQGSQLQDCSQEHTTHSGKTADEESSGQLPALERNEDSEGTESDREDSKSPLKERATSQLGSNIAELRTPAMHKKLPYVGGDTIVPETSPSEPHIQRYGDIVSQTPPVPPTEEIEDAFDLFTQDVEFNNLIQSPSPRRTKSLRASQAKTVTIETNVVSNLGDKLALSGTRTSEIGVNASLTEQHGSEVAPSLASKDCASDYTSEYVTAPTGLTLESPSGTKVQSSIRADGPNSLLQAPSSKELPGNFEHGLKVSGMNTISADDKVRESEMEQQDIPTEIGKASPCHSTSLSHDEAKDPQGDKDNDSLGTGDEMLDMGHPESGPANKTRTSSRLPKRLIKQSKASSSKTADDATLNLAAEVTEVLPNRLRSATQLRGSSRALRRLLEDSVAAPTTPMQAAVAPVPTVQKNTRSSRRSSTNNSEKAQSTEPDANVTPTLSTRRRTLSTQPAESGLFDGMAFSITYSANRENEKQEVLSLIRKNGGRVLEKGFDELFHVNSLQTAVARNNESASLSNDSTLTLTAAARVVGFACVIADEHSRRVKFMQALALGLPCISGRWIEHCVARKEILDWEQYHLAAGESSFLGGAIRSRNLPSYPASTAKFADRFASRPKLLTGKSILIITGKGRVEERRKPYFFLTQALGARRVKHVPNNQEARKFLLEAEMNGEEWNWVYVDENENEAEKAIFGAGVTLPRKRKRGLESSDEGENITPPPKKVRIVSDEYVIQSLILGKFLEE